MEPTAALTQAVLHMAQWRINVIKDNVNFSASKIADLEGLSLKHVKLVLIQAENKLIKQQRIQSIYFINNQEATNETKARTLEHAVHAGWTVK